MDYVPGTEDLEARSLRLPTAAWEEIERRAQVAKRKPLEWLRLQIYDRVLLNNGSAKRRSA